MSPPREENAYAAPSVETAPSRPWHASLFGAATGIWALLRLTGFVIGVVAHHPVDEVLKRGVTGTLASIGAFSLFRARRLAPFVCSAAAVVTVAHNAYRLAGTTLLSDPDQRELVIVASTNGVPIVLALYAVLARPRVGDRGN